MFTLPPAIVYGFHMIHFQTPSAQFQIFSMYFCQGALGCIPFFNCLYYITCHYAPQDAIQFICHYTLSLFFIQKDTSINIDVLPLKQKCNPQNPALHPPATTVPHPKKQAYIYACLDPLSAHPQPVSSNCLHFKYASTYS